MSLRDDILIASETASQHEAYLRTLFHRLEQHDLVINRNKCVFGVNEIAFLGHRVNEKGITPLPEKVRVIRNFLKPRSVKSLQEFLGMLNYYHRFLPHIAAKLIPLYNALAGRKKHATITWSPETDTASNAAKTTLANATLLVHPVAGAPTALTVDVSQIAVGAVLEQLVINVWQPLGFFSRKLREPQETKYPAFDRELLGAFLAIRHFRYFLEGRRFRLYTDHCSTATALRCLYQYSSSGSSTRFKPPSFRCSPQSLTPRDTRRLLTSKFVWPHIALDAAKWTRACIPCQQCKTTQHIRAPLQDFPEVHRHFDHLHIDVVGPLPQSQNYMHILTLVDRFTRWPEALSVKDTSAISLARVFLHGWVSRFGTPSQLTSDRGS